MEIELRWILIAISVAVLILIVFDGMRRIKRQQQGMVSSEPDEMLDEEMDDDTELDAVVLVRTTVKQPEFYDEEDSFEQDPIIPEKVAGEYVSPRKTVQSDTPEISANNNIFVLSVMAPSGTPFSGSQLLPALLSLGMRYGDMSIFHRHEHINGNGAILFSLASASEPGIFNLDAMESQYFPGLTLFLQVPGPAHPTNALNLMVQTAKRLAKALDGNVYDDERRLLTDSILEQRYFFRLRQILGKI